MRVRTCTCMHTLVLTLFHLWCNMVGMSEDNLREPFLSFYCVGLEDWTQVLRLGCKQLSQSADLGLSKIAWSHSAYLLQSYFPSSAWRPWQKHRAGLGGDCFLIVSRFCLFFKPFQPFLPPVVSVPAPLLSTGHLALSRPFELASGCQSVCWLAGGKTKALRISRGGTGNYWAARVCGNCPRLVSAFHTLLTCSQ